MLCKHTSVSLRLSRRDLFTVTTLKVFPILLQSVCFRAKHFIASKKRKLFFKVFTRCTRVTLKGDDVHKLLQSGIRSSVNITLHLVSLT